MIDENTFLTDRQLVSILVPCYNEEAVLHEFYRRTVQVIDGISRYDFQFMFVNDGSRDHTLDIMRNFMKRTVAYRMSICRAISGSVKILSQIHFIRQ